MNLIFIKVDKSASSTGGGVARRVAHSLGLGGVGSGPTPEREPRVWATHGRRYAKEPTLRRLSLRAFVFTFVREPVARCMSSFYFSQVTRRGVSPTVANKLAALEACEDFAYDYLRPENASTVDETVAAYDLIGVAERFDDSVVLLAHLLNVSIGRVLYLSAKTADGKTKDARGALLGGRDAKLLATHIPLSREPPEVRAAAHALPFAKDRAILRKATDRLDRAYADVRGLNDTLRTFKRLRELAVKTCSCEPPQKILPSTRSVTHKATGLVCGPTGIVGHCLWKDNGCGFDCLDNLCAGKPGYPSDAARLVAEAAPGARRAPFERRP